MSEKLGLFLRENNIEVLPRKEIEREKRELRFYDPLEYLNTLSEIHKEFLKEENRIRFKFRNDIWKQVQIFKLWSRRVERLEDSNKLINKALDASKKSLECIYNISYKELIRRAMEREEVCIGRIYYEVKNGEKRIFIKNTEDIKFNMVEDDYYNYLKKIRGNYKDELKDLLLEVVEKESLDFKSYVYINSLIQYPYNSMRYLQNNYIKDLKIKSNELEELLVKDYLI
ncbi:hypothetical protein [Clostridium perfringens]|uniref:hypothetical protein n=1 Tax=Clostridium perfringens TaxID=1502 RepID=UPI0013E2F2AA|nr:hypothetical protein [Clostridium perfringens]NGU15449.1 hypothetical protein [Clostridium perfringens]